MACGDKNIITSTGASHFISTDLAQPATHDIAGFEALAYTEVGEVQDLATGGGRNYNLTGFTALGDEEETQLKDSYTQGVRDVTVGMDGSNDGQLLLSKAVKLRDPVAFKIVLKNGDIRYYKALVTSEPETIGSSGTVVTTQYSQSQRCDTIKLTNTGVLTVSITTAGTGYTDGTFTATQGATSGTGKNAEFEVTIAAGAVTAVKVLETGSGYAATDTIDLTIVGNAATTDAVLTVDSIVPEIVSA